MAFEDGLKTLESIEAKLQPLVFDTNTTKEKLFDEAMEVIGRLKSQVDGFRHLAAQKYRPSSESVSPNQLALSMLSHIAGGDTEEASDAQEPGADVSAYKRMSKQPRRKTDLSSLRRVVVDKALTAAELACATCDEPRKDIGFDKSETLEFTPPELVIKEERVHKYACSTCKDGVTSAKPSGKLIPGSLVTPSLMAQTMTSKVLDSMPFYRQSKMFERFGVQISDKLIGEWFLQGAGLLAVFQNHYRNELLKSHLISFDDTTFKIQDTDHPKNIKRGHVWIYLGDTSRIAFCDISPDWKGVHPLKVLDDFSDTLQHDGYAGINPIYKNGIESPTKAGCMDHARRKFMKAWELGDKRAAAIVELMQELYRIERNCQLDGLAHGDVLERRQEFSVPIMADIDELAQKLKSPGKSRTPLAKAITYYQKQREALGAYLDDGKIPISNIHVENIIRIIALLRKNALFFGSDNAAQKYAAVITVLLNAALQNVNPFDYLKAIFEMMATGETAKSVIAMTPQVWAAKNQRH
jgi:transposase